MARPATEVGHDARRAVDHVVKEAIRERHEHAVHDRESPGGIAAVTERVRHGHAAEVTEPAGSRRRRERSAAQRSEQDQVSESQWFAFSA